MAQVLVRLSELEKQTLVKINRYNKPVKTKHMATRLKVDRPTMAQILNVLRDRNKIKWHNPQPGDEDRYMGWIKIPSRDFNKIE